MDMVVKILTGTGRGTAEQSSVVEGPGAVESGPPVSAPRCHLPVPGRN